MFNIFLCNALLYVYVAEKYNDWGWIFPIEMWNAVWAPLVLMISQLVFVFPVFILSRVSRRFVNWSLFVTIVYLSSGVNV